jgi:hypothetical protein
MAGPYDYSINIPQPPAQNFLQSLTGIMQLRQMQDQSAIQQQQAAIQQQNAAFQQQMQPLEMARVKAATDAANAAASGQGIQNKLNQLTLDQRKLVSSTLQNYLNDDTKTIKDIIPALPYLDTTAVENIGKAEQIRVNREVDTALKEGKEITANDIRGWSNRQTLLKGPEQQQFQQSFLAMTPQFQSAAKTGMISAVNAAFSGNMGEARKAAAEVQQALINSKDSSPAAKAVSNSFGKIVDLIDQDPNLPKEVLALNVVNAAGLIGEPKLAEETLKVYKEFGDLIRPSGTGAGKGKSQADGVSDKQQDTINKLTFDATQIRNTTAGFDEQLNLILDFAEQNPKEFKTGVLASIENWASGKMGIAQQGKNLRSAFQRFTTEDWVKRAEPLKGGLNKEEGERLERGVPNIMTATPAELLSFGRLVSKINLLDADQKDLNAAWQQNAESLQAKAPVEFEAAGLTVKPGDTWAKTQTKLLAGYKKKNEAQLQEDLLRLKRIEQAEKSGQSPIPNMYNLGGAPQPQQPAAAPNQSTISSDRQSLLNRYR